MRGDGYDRHPERSERIDEGQIAGLGRQIQLVHDQQRIDAGISRAGDVTIDDERIAGRARCHDDAQLIEVGRERLAATAAVGPAENVAAWPAFGDGPFVIAGRELEAHFVAGDEVEVLALELAGNAFAPGALHDHAAPVGLDDATGILAGAHGVTTAGVNFERRRSIRAAGGGCESWNAEYRGSGVSVVALSL